MIVATPPIWWPSSRKWSFPKWMRPSNLRLPFSYHRVSCCDCPARTIELSGVDAAYCGDDCLNGLELTGTPTIDGTYTPGWTSVTFDGTTCTYIADTIDVTSGLQRKEWSNNDCTGTLVETLDYDRAHIRLEVKASTGEITRLIFHVVNDDYTTGFNGVVEVRVFNWIAPNPDSPKYLTDTMPNQDTLCTPGINLRFDDGEAVVT